MAGLSTVANAFSVVGLADVVFRLGVDTAGIYSRYRNASKDIASLVDEIKAAVTFLVQIRVYLDEYNQSPYVQGDGQTIPQQLLTTLSGFEKELIDLQQLARKDKIEPHDGLAVKMMKSWRWTLQKEHASKYCKRIRDHSSKLQTILDLIGRKNEIVLRKQLQSTRADISTTGFAVRQALNSMEDSLNSNQAQNNLLIQNQNDLISQFIKQSENHHFELLERIPNLTLEQTEDDDFIFQGDNLGAIVLPLLLVKSDLYKAIKMLQKNGILKVSRSEAQWILQNFDNLLATAHQAAATNLNTKPRNNHTNVVSSFSEMKKRRGPSKQRPEHLMPVIKASSFDQIDRIEHVSTICTASGVLLLETGSSNVSVKRDQSSAAPALQVFRLSFYPKPEFSSVNISMLMTNEFGRNMELQIPRIIQAYNIIPAQSNTWYCIMKNDVRGLETIFKDGNGSPNDIFDNGMSLSMVAAHCRSTEVYEFLFREGACASIFVPGKMRESRGFSLLHYIWLALPLSVHLGTYSNMNLIKKALHLSNLAIKHGCDPNIVATDHENNVIHSFILRYYVTTEDDKKDQKDVTGPYESAHLSTNDFSMIFSSMVGMGCELEGRDIRGMTALHIACLFWQWKIINALIDIGADVHTTCTKGSGIIHYLLGGYQGGQDYNGSLYGSLVLLLTNGCDPNHLNDYGNSPSDRVSSNRERFDVWVEAIRNTGYEISRIKTDFIECGHDEERIVIVSAGAGVPDNEVRLPISNITLGEWSEKQGQRLKCRKCRANEAAARSRLTDADSS